MKLTNKYSLGLCSRHPKLPCFHHPASDMHFNLDRPRLLVWAQAIKSGSVTYEKAPILSPMFKASLALKHASKNATDPDTPSAAATNLLPVTQPSTSTQGQMPFPFANFPQYSQAQMQFPLTYAQMPLSLFMGYGSSMSYPGNPFFATDLGMVSMPTKALHPSRSLPSSPLTADCTIVEFCEAYDLGEQVEAGLEKLGFRLEMI